MSSFEKILKMLIFDWRICTHYIYRGKFHISIRNWVFGITFLSTCTNVKHKPTGCHNKHGNSVTSSISSLLWISIVIPDLKSHNIVMSAWVYFMKTVNGCKDVSIMSLQDEQWRRTSLLCLYSVMLLVY